jgi:hypothetical protein
VHADARCRPTGHRGDMTGRVPPGAEEQHGRRDGERPQGRSPPRRLTGTRGTGVPGRSATAPVAPDGSVKCSGACGSQASGAESQHRGQNGEVVVSRVGDCVEACVDAVLTPVRPQRPDALDVVAAAGAGPCGNDHDWDFYGPSPAPDRPVALLGDRQTTPAVPVGKPVTGQSPGDAAQGESASDVLDS